MLALGAALAPPARAAAAHRNDAAHPPHDRCSLAASRPAPVKDLRCEMLAGGVRVAGATAADVDAVSIEVTSTAAPTYGRFAPADVHFVAATDSAGEFSAVVPLTNAVVRVASRSHSRGCAEDAGNGTWSVLVNSSACISSGAAASRQPLEKPNKSARATHWLEVYRSAEQLRMLPDFLDNHDSGDAGGVGALISMSVQNDISEPGFYALPITRYCVEVLNATVDATTTTTEGAAASPSPYADYRSTNPVWQFWQSGVYRPLIPFGEVTPGTEYASWCALLTDRNIAGLAKEHVECCDTDTSSPTFQNCEACCSNASAAASRTLTGMCPVGLPVYTSPPAVGVYPHQLPPIGRWFSHPVGGRCPLGAAVGEGGCSWQRAPVAHSVYLGELLGPAGMNRTAGFNASGFGEAQPPAQTRGNVAVFRRVFAQKAMPPCGA
jgi:hypothetical protein